MAPWFLQRLLRDRQALSEAPAGQGQYGGQRNVLHPQDSSRVHVFDIPFFARFNLFTTNHILYIIADFSTAKTFFFPTCCMRMNSKKAIRMNIMYASLHLHYNVGADF